MKRVGTLAVLAVVFIAIKLGDVSGVERKEPSAEYMARARALAEAQQIRATLKDERQADTVAFERVWVKEKALAPDPPFANLESLAYLEDGFLTYWNEADGDHVDRFWRLVAESGLPFQRRDIVRDVLRRGRISGA
jgi:hypothetical protein